MTWRTCNDADLKQGAINPEPPKGVCTCHPADDPPRPCPGLHALSECRAAVAEEPVDFLSINKEFAGRSRE